MRKLFRDNSLVRVSPLFVDAGSARAVELKALRRLRYRSYRGGGATKRSAALALSVRPVVFLADPESGLHPLKILENSVGSRAFVEKRPASAARNGETRT